MEPRVMKLNGREFALIVSTDGKEQALVLPSELTRAVSAEGKGKLVTIPSSSNLNIPQSQSIGQSLGQNRTFVSVTNTPSSVGGWSEKELTNWAPKLGTDLDSKWLQRNEIDYLVSQPTGRNENQQAQQAFNSMKREDMTNTYIPVHLERGTNVPIMAKVDPQSLRQRLASVNMKPVGLHTDNQMASKAPSIGTTKNVILVSRGQMAGRLPQTIQGGVVQGKTDAGNLVHYLGQGLNIKTFDMAKATHQQSVVSPVYKSKLEKAIAQNNLNNTANSQNLTVTPEGKTSQGTLKQLLNTGEYKLKLNPTLQVNQTYNKNISLGPSSMQEVRPMPSLLEADILKELETRTSTNLNLVNPILTKPLKTKLKDQNLMLTSELRSEKPQYFTIGNQTYQIPQTRTISKPMPDKPKPCKSSTPSLKANSQITVNTVDSITPITSQLQLNQTPATVSSASMNTKVKPISQESPQSVSTNTAVGPISQDAHERIQSTQSVQPEVIVEKKYIDDSLPREILDTMWQLREKELFCDAVIFTGDKQVKLHKIVLAGVSTVMHTKVVESGDRDVMLQLPQDITYTHLMLFVSYLYHGSLLLTVDNVQQLYRLSGLFSMEQLKRHCYDFCKLSKMGHLIISCPYQEAAKQVVDVPKSISQPLTNTRTVKEKPIPRSAKSPVSQTMKSPVSKALKSPVSQPMKSPGPPPMKSPVSQLLKSPVVQPVKSPVPQFVKSPVPQPAKSPVVQPVKSPVSQPTKSLVQQPIKSPGHQPMKLPVTEPSPVLSPTNKQPPQTKTPSKKDVKTTDIDWMNSDPSQSNIPIRKRGRTRKGLTSPSEGSSTDNQSEVQSITITFPKKQTDIVKENNPIPQNIPNIVKRDLFKPRSEVPKKKAAARETQKPKDTVSVEEPAQQITELPDPLATGKIDESELMKIVPTIGEQNKKSPKPKLKPTPSKTMVTRFRNRPKNMSVIEAASQKKAKSNDSFSIYTNKTAGKQSGKGKKQLNTAKKSAEKVKVNIEKPEVKEQPKLLKTRTIQSPVLAGMLAKKPIATLKTPEKSTIHKENHVPQRIEKVSEVVSEKGKKPNSVSENSDPVSSSLENGTAKPTPEKTHSLKRPLDESNTLVINFAAHQEENVEEQAQSDSKSTVPSPPKKAKQRKTTEDQPDSPKDTVYMRPPPKKRTKEIREMMKNEDVVIEEEKNMAAIESLIQFPETSVKEGTEEVEKVVQLATEENKPVVKSLVKKTRRKFVKDGSLLKQVLEIELSGRLIEGEKQFKCCLCSSVFIFARRTVTHLINTHDIDLEEANQHIVVEPRSSTPKICDICGYQTKELNVYYIHYHKYFRHGIPLPKGWEPFTCDLCKKEFFTKFQLREHKLIHFEDNPFVCEHCGSGFRSRTCLNSHVFHKHNPVRRHACNMCPKTFKTATQLKVHKRIHSGDKPFACPDLQCNYRSTTRGNMRLHLINRHKYNNENTKEIMNILQPSIPPEPMENTKEEYESQKPEAQTHMSEPHISGFHAHLGQEQADLNEDRAVAMASDPATLTTLVEAAVAEVNNARGYTVQDVQEHSMTSVLPSVESMANQLIDQNQAANQTSRDYDIGLVHQGNMVQSMNYSEHQDHCDNLSVHVPMTVQAEQDMQHGSNILMQNEEQGGSGMQGYHQDIGQHSLMVIPHQEYNDQEFAQSSQNYIIPQDPRLHTSHSHQIPLKTRLDPGSREARMIVKQALQGHEPRSLLKTTILKAGSIGSSKFMRDANEGSSLSLDSRSLLRDHLPQSIHQFAEDNALVIDTQDHQEPQLVIDTDQVVQDNQMQDQYRGAHSNTMFRGHEINLTSHPQHQSLDPQHLQSFQSSSMAPPLSYSSSSHSLITTIPVSELSTSHANLTLTSVDQDHFQGEDVHHGQVQQSQGYDNNVVQSQINTTVTSEGNMYVGYYQQNFPIENY